MEAADPTGEREAARRLVAALPDALAEVVAVRRWPVVSVLLDGSLARGDFLPGASDLDATVTVADASARAADAVAELARFLEERARDALPARPAGRKPFGFDVQGQSLADVEAAGRRAAADWSADDVPPGYPKLWLYAFDQVRHHAVLYGEDVTARYTRLPPAAFVPIRLTRLARAVAALGDGASDYDKKRGTVSQLKNAWEILRAVHLARGGDSIAKPDVLAAASRAAPTESLRRGIELAWDAYRRGPASHAKGIPALRRALHAFALEALARAGARRVE